MLPILLASEPGLAIVWGAVLVGCIAVTLGSDDDPPNPPPLERLDYRLRALFHLGQAIRCLRGWQQTAVSASEKVRANAALCKVAFIQNELDDECEAIHV